MKSAPPPLPAEWSRHSAVWVGWPRLDDEWRGLIEQARDEIATFIETLGAFVPVCVAIGDEQAGLAARDRGIDRHATLHAIPTGDIWLRDTGPIFGRTAAGDVAAHVFGFNGWGGKYQMPGDETTAGAIAALHTDQVTRHPLILEGGAIDVDGTGLLLTTRECLLNPNRNGETTEEAIEAWLHALLGATRVIWVERGLLNDHTDGHIDNAARFIAPGHVVCQRANGNDDPHAERLAEIEIALRRSGLTVSTIPSPGLVIDHEGEVVPASHMNFLISNGVVLVPTFDSDSGDAACLALAPLFPDRKVIGLPSRAIVCGGGGSFHCMTKDVPASD